ncbi:hypothetical protein CR513_25011, partial [Mucuna pruriens]
MSCQVFHVLHFKIAEVREVSGSGSGLLVKHRALKDYFDDTKPDIGVGTSSVQDYLFLSFATFRAFFESRKISLLGLHFIMDRLSQGDYSMIISILGIHGILFCRQNISILLMPIEL